MLAQFIKEAVSRYFGTDIEQFRQKEQRVNYLMRYLFKTVVLYISFNCSFQLKVQKQPLQPM